MTLLGGAAQVAVARCPNERTLDPAVCSYNRPTYAPASRTMTFTPQCSPAFMPETKHCISSSKIMGITISSTVWMLLAGRLEKQPVRNRAPKVPRKGRFDGPAYPEETLEKFVKNIRSSHSDTTGSFHICIPYVF